MPADDLPRALRILPNRRALQLGLGAGLMLCSALMLHGPPAAGPPELAPAGYWSALAAGAIAAIGCAARLLVQLPVIEASELGIAVWLEGPYRRPFFAPWRRVRSIVLTRVGPAGGRDALGIELDQDDSFHLPAAARSRPGPASGAARADLAWSSRSISGDPHRWVELLRRMKAAYVESSG